MDKSTKEKNMESALTCSLTTNSEACKWEKTCFRLIMTKGALLTGCEKMINFLDEHIFLLLKFSRTKGLRSLKEFIRTGRRSMRFSINSLMETTTKAPLKMVTSKMGF